MGGVSIAALAAAVAGAAIATPLLVIGLSVLSLYHCLYLYYRALVVGGVTVAAVAGTAHCMYLVCIIVCTCITEPLLSVE